MPLFAGPADTMGLIVLILLSTFILSIVLGGMSKNKIIFIYPIIISILFIPSIYIYYNDSALIHSIWYLVDSYIGLIIGIITIKIINKLGGKKHEKK
jgi:chromate transport protein ChrA